MAARYDLRSEDHDKSYEAGPYASLPGTRPMGFVPHHATHLKSQLAPGRQTPGCHPSRWIHELINNKFSTCDIFERARQFGLDSEYTWEHPHRLVINGKQSYSATTDQILSSVCLECQFHFVFRIAWEGEYADHLCNDSASGWPIEDNMFPWHHLVWAGSDSDPNLERDQSKYYPIIAREYFVCSASPCTFNLTLEISKPRMSPLWTKLLLDHETIRDQLDAAKEQEPKRYETATDDWAYQAPLNLNTYLKNLLEARQEDTRSISKRNKRFAVLFGPRCFDIFRELEFAEEIQERDGIDEGTFKPKAPPPADGPNDTTRIGTFRAYVEDVRAEVQSLIHKAGQTEESPSFCTPVLHRYLQCKDIPGVGDSALVDLDRYKMLGVLPQQGREIIVNAYKRQWDLVPNHRRKLVDSLVAVANDTGDEMLQEYAVTQSSVFDSQMQRPANDDDDGIASQALNFLGLEPPNNYTGEALIQAFRQKLARDPADAGTARSMLILIAKESTDDTIQAMLLMESDAKMSLETARAVLGAGSSAVSWQESVRMAKAKLTSSKGKEESETYLDALDSVADHTDSGPLKQACMELRHLNGIGEAGSTNSAANDTPVDLTLPVGLHNIGNTCYLNSLLQYLFTVKPIRDIVLNYDELKLELTDESIEKRRLGGNKMSMDRGEAVVAQAFANELAILFRNLEASNQSATRPSQRLANAVLLSTHTLLETSKQQPEKLIGPEAPPLPARPSPAPPTTAANDVNMADAADPRNDLTETRSEVSEQTLVDREEIMSGLDKVQTLPAEDAREQNVSVAEIEVDADMGENQPDAVKTTEGEVPTEATDGETVTDVAMADSEGAETVDQKVLNALEHQKRSSGTDQQDVEEVMGSIINRLQAAIRPSSTDSTGIQLEKIMETFFVTTVNYTKKFDEKEYQNEISFDRSITAFPATEGPCSLYDALGRNFDQQIIEDDKLSRYTAIKTLPPVLHVLIQRSQSIGSKNGNPVIIPETLYLDRFMDAAHDSDVFRERKEEWITASRIEDLKSQLAKVGTESLRFPHFEPLSKKKDEPSEEMSELNADNESAGTGSGLLTPQTWDFDGPLEDDFVLVNSARPDFALTQFEPPPEDMELTGEALRTAMQTELATRESALDAHLESLKHIPYRLHAVICHRGHLTSGHYWVWIHDFEANVWRWYNDAQVKENRDTAEVLKTLSTSGEPYYLCYVRDGDKENYVDVPKRQVPPADETPVEKPTADAGDDIEVTEILPAEPKGQVTPPPEVLMDVS